MEYWLEMGFEQCSYCVETFPLTCTTNGVTGFFVMEIFALSGLTLNFIILYNPLTQFILYGQ